VSRDKISRPVAAIAFLIDRIVMTCVERGITLGRYLSYYGDKIMINCGEIVTSLIVMMTVEKNMCHTRLLP
jgi:hypothetical protein